MKDKLAHPRTGFSFNNCNSFSTTSSNKSIVTNKECEADPDSTWGVSLSGVTAKFVLLLLGVVIFAGESIDGGRSGVFKTAFDVADEEEAGAGGGGGVMAVLAGVDPHGQYQEELVVFEAC
jgi:hypothetical protein